MVESSSFQSIVAVANGVLSIVACLCLIALTVGGVVVWREYGRAKRQLVVVQRDLAPLLASMTRVAVNLEAATATVRSDVDAIHVTVAHANDLARSAVEGAADRLRRLDSAVGAAHDEVEAALIDVVATARGVRAGASVLRGILGLAGAGAGSAGTAPGRPARSASSASERGRRAENFERGDLVNAGERRGDGGNGRGRPRARSRRDQG
jgi:hypothetical protein